MRNASTLLCFTILAGLLGACGKSDTNVAPAVAVQSGVASPAAEPAASPTTSAAAFTGVAACDDFLAAYEQCVTEKMPAQARDQMKVGLDQWKKSWRDMANNAAMKDSLPQICAQSRDASKPALQAYGCTL